jgi:hypothetical protein
MSPDYLTESGGGDRQLIIDIKLTCAKYDFPSVNNRNQTQYHLNLVRVGGLNGGNDKIVRMVVTDLKLTTLLLSRKIPEKRNTRGILR